MLALSSVGFRFLNRLPIIIILLLPTRDRVSPSCPRPYKPEQSVRAELRVLPYLSGRRNQLTNHLHFRTPSTEVITKHFRAREGSLPLPLAEDKHSANEQSRSLRFCKPLRSA